MYSAALQSLLQQIDKVSTNKSEPISDISLVIKDLSKPAPIEEPTETKVYYSWKKPSAPAIVNEVKKSVSFQQDNKKKVLFVSTHSHQYNGYSKVSWNLLKFLSTDDTFELYQYAVQKAPGPDHRTMPPSVNVHTTQLIDGGFDFSGLPKYLDEVKPDVIVIYNDAYIVSRYLEQIKTISERTFRIIVYLDQVYYTMRAPHVSILNEMADEIFVFTNTWEGVLLEHGIKKPIHVMSHGFDKSAHLTLEKAKARKKLGFAVDPFYIVSVNRNVSRKRLDILIMAFAQLVCRKPDLNIRLVCACGDGDFPLLEIFENEIRRAGGVMKLHGEKLIIMNSGLNLVDSDINLLYNAADIGVTCSDGEGFGLCAFEMMGLGKPQIVSDQIGHREFCNEKNSIVIPANHRYYIPSGHSAVYGEARSIDVEDLTNAIERYVLNPSLVEAHGAAAKDTVLEYSWSNVTRQFVTSLKK